VSRLQREDFLLCGLSAFRSVAVLVDRVGAVARWSCRWCRANAPQREDFLLGGLSAFRSVAVLVDRVGAVARWSCRWCRANAPLAPTMKNETAKSNGVTDTDLQYRRGGIGVALAQAGQTLTLLLTPLNDNMTTDDKVYALYLLHSTH